MPSFLECRWRVAATEICMLLQHANNEDVEASSYEHTTTGPRRTDGFGSRIRCMGLTYGPASNRRAAIETHLYGDRAAPRCSARLNR